MPGYEYFAIALPHICSVACAAGGGSNNCILMDPVFLLRELAMFYWSSVQYQHFIPRIFPMMYLL